MLSAVALLLAALPLLLALDNLRQYRVPPKSNGRPSISVLIPARNEENNIGDAVACVLASQDVNIELIVLDDASTDRTGVILRAIDDPRLRVASTPTLPAGWSGKQHACSHLAKEAQYGLMVFVDADVRLAPDALSRMAGYMARHDVGMASGFPWQVTVTWSEKLLLPLIHMLLLGYLPMRRMARDGSVQFGAGCGQLVIVRKVAYIGAGGHAAIRASMHDGLTLPRAFRTAGFMTGLFDATPFATCRMYHTTGAVWEGLTKNATEGMAKPVALPVWSVFLAGGHVLPFVLMTVSPSLAAAAACVCSLGLRLVLARRFRQSVLSAVLQPVGISALLLLQWAALLRAASGRKATWRGRSYTAQT
jgi:hypothetical protein